MKINFLSKKSGLRLILPAALFFVVAMAILIVDLVKTKKSYLCNILEQEVAIATNIILDKINATSHVIAKINGEIAKDPQNRQHIKEILDQYKADSAFAQIFTWTLFSWVDENDQLIVDSQYGVVPKPIDLSIRDYMPVAKQNPGQIAIGKPVFGSTSKKWMIPGGMSVADEAGKVQGALTFGMEIEKLARIIQSAIQDKNVKVKLVHKSNRLVFAVDKSYITIPNDNNALEQNFRKTEHNVDLERDLEGYPYYLVLKYDDDAISDMMWEVIYSRLVEMVLLLILSTTFLVAIYRNEKLKRQKIEFLTQKEIIANRLKSEFMIQVGHELRNFVSGISGLSNMIKDDIKNGKDVNHIENLNHIEDISVELKSFVEDLIDLNMTEDGKFLINASEGFDIEDLIERSIRILSKRVKDKNVNFKIKIPSKLSCNSSLDPKRVKQILVSIIGNAVNHSPYNSSIEISVNNLDKKIKIIVKDYGDGIDHETKVEALSEYNPLKHSRESRSGFIELKLPVVKLLVEKQGGAIDMNSILEQGTEVEIVL